MNQTYSDPEICVAPAHQVDVVVPVLNEREMLPQFLQRIKSLGLPLNLIFVDNGSSDGSLEYLDSCGGVQVIRHPANLGYGRSLADGLAASSAGRVIVIDADCEYPPEAIPALLGALETAAVVYASRFLSGESIDMSATRSWGNRLLTGMFNRIYGQKLTDLYTGMKGMRREAFSGLSFDRSGFEHVVELGAKVSRSGHPIEEISVSYTPRRAGRSKMRHLPELLKAVGCLAYYRVARHD